MLQVLGCLQHEHSPALLILAAGVCFMACFVCTNIVRRAGLVEPAHRKLWNLGAGMVYGSGVWATHFIAMLALRSGLPITYNPDITALSALMAVAGAALAFQIGQIPGLGGSGTSSGRMRAVLAGAVLGLTVGAMHYTGMSAMRLPGHLEFSPVHAVLAVLIGAGLAATALSRRLDNRPRRLLASGLLAGSILALHFIGMAGATIVPDGGVWAADSGLDERLIAITVAAVVGTVAVVSHISVAFEEKLWGKGARDANRLRRLVNNTSEGLFIHRGGKILDVNEPLARLLGRPAEALVGQDISAILPAEAVARLQDDASLRPDTTSPLEVELTAESGRRTPVEIMSRVIEDADEEGWRRAPLAHAVAVRDPTERKRAEERIRYLALHDGLTGLPNRTLLADRANQALETATREGRSIAVLCLDLDRFKTVNDLLGHDGGDQLLLQVAERLRVLVRGGDTIARLGGDEFAILQADLGAPEDAAALAGRVIEALSAPFEIEGQTFQLGTSVGVAISPADGRTVPRLLRNADTALDRAKRDGRGIHCFFEAALDQRLMQRRTLERDLRMAIERGELHLAYQPQCDTRTREMVSAEALLRWNHPQRGAVSPAEFVPLAEESGFIRPLGRWVLETACAEAAKWPIPCRVAVNISPAQFRQPDLLAVIAQVLERSGLPPQRLKMEVTEGLLIGETERALTLLRALKDMGIALSLDDFGTGYSSLSYLRRFPFDEIKIDQSFVRGLGQDVESAAIVEAVLALSRSLGMIVVAEGVETEQQLEILRSRNCPRVQGYLLGRPVPSADLFRSRSAELVPEAVSQPAAPA
ncbi:bifunctional diguanylate cyclase/phosphodiesterase [Pararoseomonas indoligenes]|uniref:EAL domain-containing protein n=1 Tax=Roseomonas indoligenes TaxID=2820811 RepID=A0A940MVU1_9PROT|nr:EAL domain-containing protein [Pararoseomonas indoligenes]MBP0491431.1 EAL domain-containing protein [Pararoseomonas indoligenes]